MGIFWARTGAIGCIVLTPLKKLRGQVHEYIVKKCTLDH